LTPRGSPVYNPLIDDGGGAGADGTDLEGFGTDCREVGLLVCLFGGDLERMGWRLCFAPLDVSDEFRVFWMGCLGAVHREVGCPSGELLRAGFFENCRLMEERETWTAVLAEDGSGAISFSPGFMSERHTDWKRFG